MSTRYLIATQIDGEYKLAQYGASDGYPAYAGTGILDYLHHWDRPRLEAALRNARLHANDIVLPSELGEIANEDSFEILAMLEQATELVELANDLDFASNSIFCEWGYVLDLDHDFFEVYKGSNETRLNPTARFARLRNTASAYEPIRLVRRYGLRGGLPTHSQLIIDCGEDGSEVTFEDEPWVPMPIGDAATMCALGCWFF